MPEESNPQIVKQPVVNQPVLRFDDVTVSFDGEVVLAGVSFAASESESRVILGAAGSGKTVLLKTAMGLVKPDSGKVYVFGKDIGKMKEQELFAIRSRIGMLFQESALFDSMTIEENVAYPLLNQKSIQCPAAEVLPKVEQALEFVELGGTLEKFPSELSGGMRRRAAIARAVVTQPPLLLYDSPTAGLDPITAHTIMALLIKERDVSQATTLVVTHRYQDGNLIANFRYNSEHGNLEPARNGAGRHSSTTFMVLKEGRLVFEGDQDQLEASKDPYIGKFVKQRV
ncbi:MAG TPA: ATP-binding cassette domain-containing protein [Candidatus Acidoferrales bacterium]|nr:ATP-binding cassette domain-containing protein [Candidatus Acidoferrales bacterium]